MSFLADFVTCDKDKALSWGWSFVCVKVKQFSCKSVEMSLRVASLDYLGIVAARLRRDAVSSRLNEDVISDIIKQVCIAQQACTV